MKEKETFANKNNEGGFTNKKKKAFTLIELLAIIVILAIIAVITVPIILNIIENSKKGAATDSAYGYKDAVNKWYVTKLSEDHDFRISGEYSVTNGVLNGLEVNNVEIPLSGDKPSSGKLHYTNNVLDDGCLVIGDYKITFNSDGSVNETIKGNCDDYEYVDSNVPTIASCSGCKFIYKKNTYNIVGSYFDEYNDMPEESDGLTNDYTTLKKDVEFWIADDDTEYYNEYECYEANGNTECESGTTSVQRPYFLGLIESEETPGKIGRAFVCGVENGTPFCLEGYNPSKDSYDANIGVLNTIGCTADASNSDTYQCTGSGMYVSVADNGSVSVGGGAGNGACDVYSYGGVVCYESDF